MTIDETSAAGDPGIAELYDDAAAVLVWYFNVLVAIEQDDRAGARELLAPEESYRSGEILDVVSTLDPVELHGESAVAEARDSLEPGAGADALPLGRRGLVGPVALLLFRVAASARVLEEHGLEEAGSILPLSIFGEMVLDERVALAFERHASDSAREDVLDVIRSIAAAAESDGSDGTSS